MTSTSRAPLLAAVAVAALALPTLGLAQEALPFSPRAPHVVEGAIRSAALSRPDPRIGRFAARRATSQSRARARAIESLHRWADDALARVHATPLEATAVHQAIDARVRTVGVRPLVDAGAVVVVEVTLHDLHDACDREGLPW